jgi:hypothetical protein
VWAVGCVWVVAFSILFFIYCSCLIKLGPYEIETFKLLIFLWLEALNFDDNFYFWVLLKKKIGP